MAVWCNKIFKPVHLKYHHSFKVLAHSYSVVTSWFVLYMRNSFTSGKARILWARLLENPVNPPDPVLSALSLPLAYDEDRYRSYPQTKALCALLQGLELAEAGYTVMRAIEGRMGGTSLFLTRMGTFTLKKRKKLGGHLFYFILVQFLLNSVLSLSETQFRS